MKDQLEYAGVLKQALKTFVLNADGELATALEKYSADRSRQWSVTNLQGVDRSELAIDMFLTEGRVSNQSVLDIFIQHQPELTQADRALIKGWENAFNGLFAVVRVEAERYELMNWLTEKRYWVRPNGAQLAAELARFRPGEIVITRLLPIVADEWTISGPLMLLGKLGKPKLAVAIGNFKNWFPNHLYGDAPELLAEAWNSVERLHHDFVDFFGGDRLTLSGHDLNRRLNEYQAAITQRRLAEVGLDGSKSLQELATQAGITEADMAESMEALGEDGRQVSRLMKNEQTVKMVMPSISLPDDFRRAAAVTVFVHPRWGQMFLNDYVRLTQLLDATDAESLTKLDKMTQKYLQEDGANAYIWQCLAQENPAPLIASLRRVLDRPELTLADLNEVLVQAAKPLEPSLPEIASVPLHLHNLFQKALQEVGQGASKKKSKGPRKQKIGFAV
ncbi:hypothetical protein IQ254_28285 [Nodosilinea sp. LEGE 07088]|uniref:hypothetical protein n=1 Tax=Nodosilinea sp. LEGE 07088 TaxID=2777968 RepID=UPI001880F326|nr:hypothetical protein [Nodosilinea sp. LEGE 07088]MBE9141052.1 hypothetical protein [Nodosilinea sp. LEGE 07088]